MISEQRRHGPSGLWEEDREGIAARKRRRAEAIPEAEAEKGASGKKAVSPSLIFFLKQLPHLVGQISLSSRERILS